MKYCADFETTTDPNDCRVWAFACINIDNLEDFTYGNSLADFINLLSNHKGDTFYFRNLKFDGAFIIVYLIENGWVFNTDSRSLKKHEFNTLISDKGQFYSLKLCFENSKKGKGLVTILDSLKIIPFSIEDTAKTFGLPISKLKIDYDEFRPIGHKLTDTEIEYIKGDVTIDAMALKTLFDQGLNKMTQGSNALANYKSMMSKKEFERYFPNT